MSDNKDSTPRVPHNMTGLLRFALQQTKSEDAPNSAAFNEMDEERKKFLENAFRTMTVDIVEEFEKALSTLESKEASTKQKVEALNVIRDNISSIDFANSFVKLGGTKILIDYAKSEQNELRVIAIAIIAEMAQNNPFSQQHFLEAEVLQILLPYFKLNEEVVRNALYAVSSLIRNFEPGLAKFIEIGGVAALCACLKNNDSKVFIKTGFLIASIATEFPLVRDEFVKKGALDVLLECIDPVRDYDIRTETLLYAVSELTKSEEWHPNEHVKDDLSAALNQLVTATYKLPQCEEMVAYAKQILDNMKGK